MTVEQCMGLVAAVYRSPLPMLADMQLCSILSWLNDIPDILPMIEPMASKPPEQKKVTTAAELMQLAQLAKLPTVGG